MIDGLAEEDLTPLMTACIDFDRYLDLTKIEVLPVLRLDGYQSIVKATVYGH